MQKILKVCNLVLIIAFPISWFVPLMEVGLFEKVEISIEILGLKLPDLFGLTEVTIISAIQTLWSEDKYLALIVTFFALFAPLVKTIGLSLIQFKLLSEQVKSTIQFIGKLAMADVFIIAFTCILIKGLSVGKIEILYGTYLFSACIIVSIIISYFSKPE